jgi:hypothetical protein
LKIINRDILYQGFRSTLKGLVVQGYECLLRKQKVVGSNPTQSIESSVQIPNREKRNSNEYTTVYLLPVNIINKSEGKLRDLYNREKRLKDWTSKVNTQLEEPDRSDVLRLIDHMKEQEKSTLWIIRYLSAILFLRRRLDKPFHYCSKQEIKESTNERLNLIASKEFLSQHLERIDMLRTILKEMWANYHLEKNPLKRVQILEKIEENQIYVSSYYDSTRYVMEQSAKMNHTNQDLEK